MQGSGIQDKYKNPQELRNAAQPRWVLAMWDRCANRHSRYMLKHSSGDSAFPTTPQPVLTAGHDASWAVHGKDSVFYANHRSITSLPETLTTPLSTLERIYLYFSARVSISHQPPFQMYRFMISRLVRRTAETGVGRLSHDLRHIELCPGSDITSGLSSTIASAKGCSCCAVEQCPGNVAPVHLQALQTSRA